MNNDTKNKICNTLDALSDLFVMDPYTNPMELIFKALRNSEFPVQNRPKRFGEDKHEKMQFIDLSHGDLVKALEMYTNPRNGSNR